MYFRLRFSLPHSAYTEVRVVEQNLYTGEVFESGIYFSAEPAGQFPIAFHCGRIVTEHVHTEIFKILPGGFNIVQYASAHDFEIDGIYYNITASEARTVAVTYKGENSGSYSNEYTGNITIPSEVIYNNITYSVTTIGDEAFRGCTGLTSVTIGNSVTTIGDKAFQFCDGLTSVTIGNSVTSIGDGAFYGCTGLTSVTIGNSVTTIEYGAFYNCSGLTSVTIPNSVTSIGEYAFCYCDGLTSVTIGNSVTTIGASAFYNCDGLTSVTMPNSVTTIGDYAFYNCTSLTSVTIPNSVTTIGDAAFYGCDGLTSVTIGNSVTSIGGYAFYSCDGLTSVTIPNSVTTIGEGAFRSCTSLTSVTIGNSVTTIGYEAFYYCSNLRTIYCQLTTPPSASATSIFDDDALQYATLYVPTGTKSAYESVAPWRNFWNIVEMDFTESGGINDIEDDSAETDITINSGEIVINNAENICVEVYSLAGQQVYSKRSYNGESICLDKGMYIIKIGNKSKKIVL